MEETQLLQLIFKNACQIKKDGDNLSYEIKFKQKTFEFVCPPSYPSVPPVINSHLSPEQLASVYNKANMLLTKPMIYDLVLACVKQDELDLNELKSSLIVDYDSSDVPRITAEQFFEWVEQNQWRGQGREKNG